MPKAKATKSKIANEENNDTGTSSNKSDAESTVPLLREPDSDLEPESEDESDFEPEVSRSENEGNDGSENEGNDSEQVNEEDSGDDDDTYDDDESSEENLNNYCLYIKTMQSNIIRILFESLKNILEDVNIVCNENGMKIMATNKIKVAFVHLNLRAESFREGGIYHCPKPITIGVNLPNFDKTLKAIGLNDIITFYMKKDEHARQEYKLHLYVSKPGNYQNTKLSINLLDIEEETISLPECQFNSIFTIPSHNFQKITRELFPYSSTVKFISIGKILKIIGEGDIGTSETTIGGQDSPVDPDEEPIVASFPLKYLNLFTKATNLHSSVELLFNRQPNGTHLLIVQYKVASLGTLQFGLAEKIIDPDEI